MYVACIMLCVRSFVNLCYLYRVTVLHLLFSRVLLPNVVLNGFVTIFMVVTLSSTTLILTLLFVVLRSLEVWILISRPKVYCMGTSAITCMPMFVYISFCPTSTLLSSSSSLLFLPPPPYCSSFSPLLISVPTHFYFIPLISISSRAHPPTATCIPVAGAGITER